MDSNLIDNMEIPGSLLEDDFVTGSSSHARYPTHNSLAAPSDVITFASTRKQQGSYRENPTSLPASRQVSHLSSISSHQETDVSSEYTRQESALEAELRRFTAQRDVQKSSAYYARVHYSEERDETIKCVVSTILFVAIVVLVIVYMFVVNPLV